MTIETFATFARVDGVGLEEVILFTGGKEAKSPYDDPNIVRPVNISNYYERLGLENFIEDQENI